MAQVDLNHVTKEFKEIKAVQDVNLSVADQEFLVLLGPSGCGKTTTLRMVAGLEELSSGSIEIGNRDVTWLPPKDRDIAMVFQNYALYPHMTVFENMAFGLKLRKVSRTDIERRVHEAAEILGLNGLLTRRPKELSGGQRQRVALGRAIVREPKAFLMDEPLSNLDAKLRTQTRVELKRLHQRLGATVIYVTHDQTEAMTLGDRIVVMREGVVQQVDTPDGIYHRPANTFVATFVGTPPMNLFPATIERQSGRVVANIENQTMDLPNELQQAASKLTGNQAIIGIRPEDIVFAEGGQLPSGYIPLDAMIRLVEPMGHEIIAHLDIGSSECVVRTSNEWKGSAGNSARIGLASSRLHIFDPESERSLLYS